MTDRLRRKRTREHGNTLIELMIVTACIGIIGVGLRGTGSVRLRIFGAQRQLLRATSAAESELERLRGAAPLKLRKANHRGELISAPFDNAELRHLPAGAHGVRETRALAGGLVKVVVRVIWDDAREQRREVRLVSMLSAEATP